MVFERVEGEGREMTGRKRSGRLAVIGGAEGITRLHSYAAHLAIRLAALMVSAR
jgi:hypothetical protein